MRILGPLLCIAAIGLFVATLLVGVLLSIAWPLVALMIAVLLFVTWHFVSGFKVLTAAVEGVFDAFQALRDTAWALWHPLRPVRFQVPPPMALPHLERIANRVAEQMGQAPFDRVVVTPVANFGVMEVPTEHGLTRVLEAGTPILFVLTVDELRAVIAHEVAHLALEHTRWRRVLGRWITLIDVIAEDNRDSIHPLSLSLRFSGWLLRSAHEPWSRERELDADALAARTMGRDVTISALRKSHEQAPGVELMMHQIAERSVRAGVAPHSWTECAFRIYRELGPRKQRELARLFRGDPFDVDGLSHPPLAQRSAALVALPRSGPGNETPAIAALPDVLQIEAELSRRIAPRVRRVPARQWRDAAREDVVERTANDAVAAATGYVELDLGG
ncbi:MAG: M48 family metallopeptidase [Deltaproteobacteria bacterium]